MLKIFCTASRTVYTYIVTALVQHPNDIIALIYRRGRTRIVEDQEEIAASDPAKSIVIAYSTDGNERTGHTEKQLSLDKEELTDGQNSARTIGISSRHGEAGHMDVSHPRCTRHGHFRQRSPARD